MPNASTPGPSGVVSGVALSLNQELKGAVVSRIWPTIFEPPASTSGESSTATSRITGPRAAVYAWHFLTLSYFLLTGLAGKPGFSGVSLDLFQARGFKITDSPLWMPFLISTK
jgi:hypothetical protein